LQGAGAVPKLLLLREAGAVGLEVGRADVLHAALRQESLREREGDSQHEGVWHRVGFGSEFFAGSEIQYLFTEMNLPLRKYFYLKVWQKQFCITKLLFWTVFRIQIRPDPK